MDAAPGDFACHLTCDGFVPFRGSHLRRCVRLQVYRNLRRHAAQRVGGFPRHRATAASTQGLQGGQQAAEAPYLSSTQGEHPHEGQEAPGQGDGQEKSQRGLLAEVEVLPRPLRTVGSRHAPCWFSLRVPAERRDRWRGSCWGENWDGEPGGLNPSIHPSRPPAQVVRFLEEGTLMMLWM